MILITGGAGFIGANFALDWINQCEEPLINLDKLAYSGNLYTLERAKDCKHHTFVHGDVADRPFLVSLLERHQPRAVIHFAAESHVDRSIHGPDDFIQTNIVGTFHLLEAVRQYCTGLPKHHRSAFRFIHISTDEVFGSLESTAAAFNETNPYLPNSPYAASKASADHLVRAWHHTYGMNAIVTNCSNNYGPYQFPEKLIPLMIHNAMSEKMLPIYGNGQQIRDWLYVKDHCAAIRRVLEAGKPGQTYNIGGRSERTNIEVVSRICSLLDELRPRKDLRSYAEQIEFVTDRPGHDRRYAMDSSKIENELGWFPAETFETGLRETVEWYLNNKDWVNNVTSGAYRSWIETNYGSSRKTACDT